MFISLIKIDGNWGEGGGAVVRVALALSTITQKPFSVENIRSGRKDAGLKQQHVHCITALKDLCNAKAENAFVGSKELKFYPGPIKGGNVKIDIETAGSITLLLQAVLMPCFFAEKPVRLTIIGGTNVAWSMPIEYFKEVLAVHLKKFCEKLDINLVRRGYYPKGGGKVELRIKPKYAPGSFVKEAPRIDLTEQEHLISIKGISHASKDLEKKQVAERQTKAARRALAQLECPISIATEYADTLSTGSGITLWAIFSKDKDEINELNPIRLGADALGEQRKTSEEVGTESAKKLLVQIHSKAPVDSHLGDNLIPLMGLLGECRIKVAEITNHLRTNIYVVEKFLGKKFLVDEEEKIVSVE